MTDDCVLWAFEHFYHLDKANACIHCAPVKFSPLTFRLANQLLDGWSTEDRLTPELAEVHRHIGTYELDEGR